MSPNERYEKLKRLGKCTNHPDRDGADGKTSCLECSEAAKRRRSEAETSGKCKSHAERSAVGGKTRCQECLDKDRWNRIKAKYGWTKEKYLQAYKEQNGKCAVCGDAQLPIGEGQHASEILVVDHDHKHGHVRSLLCNSCNRVLGLFKEDTKRIRKVARNLIKYIDKWEPEDKALASSESQNSTGTKGENDNG